LQTNRFKTHPFLSPTMELSTLVGPSGTILTTAEKILPGFTLWLGIGAVIIFVIFLEKISKLEENIETAAGLFAALGLLSYILTGNMAIAIVLLFIGAGIWYVLRERWKEAEHVSSEARALETPELAAIHQRIENLEENLRKGPEGELARGGEEIEKIEEYADVLDRAETNLATGITNASARLGTSTEKMQQALTELGSYAGIIEQELQHMQSIQNIDQTAQRSVVSTVQNMAKSCDTLAKQEASVFEGRKLLVADLLKNTDLLKEVTQRAKRLSTGTTQISKKLNQNLGKKTLDKCSTVISAKKTKLKALYAALLLAKKANNQALQQAITEQLAQLKSEIAEMETTYYRLVSMKTLLDRTIAALTKNLKEVQQNLNILVQAEKPILAREKQIIKTTQEMKTGVEKLSAAGNQFTQNANKLSSETLDVPEQAVIETTTNVGAIFTHLFDLQKNHIEFNTNETLPFINDMTKILADTTTLAPLLQSLRTAFETVARGFESLQEAAATIIGAAETRDAQLMRDAQKQIQSLTQAEETQRQQLHNQTQQALTQAKGDTDNMNRWITQQYTSAQQIEQQILQKLSTALRAIVQNKTRVNAAFEKKANQFTSQMTNAQDTLSSARK